MKIEEPNRKPCSQCGHPERCHVYGCVYANCAPVCRDYEPTNDEVETARYLHAHRSIIKETQS